MPTDAPGDPPEIPLALHELTTPRVRAMFEQADVVIGVDLRTGAERAFYGAALLARIIASGQAMELRLLKIPVDFENETDLQVVAAACLAWKGSYDVNEQA